MDTQNDFFSQIIEALRFAAEKHKDQRRKNVDETPYINHPIAVAEFLASVGGIEDEDILMAALLHDTVEDTETTVEELAERFGNRVAGFVAEVTDDKTLPKQERKRLQVVNAPHKSDGAKQIKIADKVCNLQSIFTAPPRGWNDQRKREYFDWANNVFQGLQGVNPALDAAFMDVYSSYE